jgi:hypothetical protein
MTATTTQIDRRSQIAEALADLERVFFHPGALGDCSVKDCAVSLASEFTGPFRDDEVTGRLAKLCAAEDVGRAKEALRHLVYVRRKIRTRWTMVSD